MNLEVQLVGRQWQQSRVRLSAPQDVRTTCAKNALKQVVLQILYFLKMTTTWPKGRNKLARKVTRVRELNLLNCLLVLRSRRLLFV